MIGGPSFICAGDLTPKHRSLGASPVIRTEYTMLYTSRFSPLITTNEQGAVIDSGVAVV